MLRQSVGWQIVRWQAPTGAGGDRPTNTPVRIGPRRQWGTDRVVNARAGVGGLCQIPRGLHIRRGEIRRSPAQSGPSRISLSASPRPVHRAAIAIKRGRNQAIDGLRNWCHRSFSAVLTSGHAVGIQVPIRECPTLRLRIEPITPMQRRGGRAPLHRRPLPISRRNPPRRSHGTRLRRCRIGFWRFVVRNDAANGIENLLHRRLLRLRIRGHIATSAGNDRCEPDRRAHP